MGEKIGRSVFPNAARNDCKHDTLKLQTRHVKIANTTRDIFHHAQSCFSTTYFPLVGLLLLEQMNAAAFPREVSVHLFDEAALTEDDNPVARLQLRVTIDEGALVFTSYKAT